MCACKHPAGSHQVVPQGETVVRRACLEFRCGCSFYIEEAD